MIFDPAIKTLSVKAAIKRGKLFLLWIPLTTMLTLFGISIFLFETNLTLGICTFLLGFILPLVYYSRVSVLWKLWAFDRVRNVRELYKKGIEAQIIYRQNSFYDKLEIKSKSEKRKIELLYERLYIPDEPMEYFETPPETYLENTGAKHWAHFIVYFVMLVLSIFFLLYYYDSIGGNIKILLLAAILLPIVIYEYYKYRKIIKNKKFVRLNDQGIETETHGFISWYYILDIDVINSGKELFYAINDDEGPDVIHQSIDLENYEFDLVALEKAIKTYQYRYQQWNK